MPAKPVLFRPLYCPICGQRVRVETDGQHPEVLRIPDHSPHDPVNLCLGSVVTVTIDFDRCKRCDAKMIKHSTGLCVKCHGNDWDELDRLEKSMARLDEADPKEVDADEYAAMLKRIVTLRESISAPASA